MSSPPPDQWRPPQPMGGPSQGPPFGPSPWGPPQPPGPPNRGSGLKWVLGAIVLLVVVAVSVGATLLFTRGDTGGESPTGTASPTSSSGPASDIASANDKGPVSVITEDPTCAPWTPINNTLANRQQRSGWTNRDPSIPSVTWSPDLRTMFREAGDAMRDAADQAIPLVKMTPHRVMRELYEQFIAYARAYDESVPTYEATDNHFANVAVSTTFVLTSICAAAENGSAAARGPLIRPANAPTATAPLGDPAKPQRFLASPDSVCRQWKSAGQQYDSDIATWAQTDPTVPVDQWSAEQRTLSVEATSVLESYADTMESLGAHSSNPVLQDIATLAAVYLRSYSTALPTYGPNDQYLYTTAVQASAIVDEACLAAEA
jgi:hypothetical protein